MADTEPIRRSAAGERAVVILNPIAGGGRGRRLRAEITRELAARRIDFTIQETAGPGHATELARDAVSDGADLVLAAGGDGTIHEVVNGLMTAPAAAREPVLAVLPVGTGNDFIKAVYPGRGLAAALRALDTGHVRRLDVGRAEWDGEVEYFVNGFGTGVDVEVVRRLNRLPHLPGLWRYLAAAIQALAVYRPVPLRLSLDGRVRERRTMLLAVGNGPCQAGGFYLTPQATPDDHRFDVCIVDEMNYLEIATVLPRVFRGTHGRSRKVTMERARGITVEGSGEGSLFFQMDGELRQAHGARVQVQVAPAALPVLAPVGGAGK